MRKRNSLNYETVKSLFDEASESEAGESYFKVSGGGSVATVVQVPTSIMHRLFRLGQAYGIRQLRYFEPEVKIVVGTVELPEFVKDLRRLLGLLNDEVLHEHINRLLTALESPPGLSVKTVAVSTGSYFEKRA
jgi:hypothetical protein